MRVGFEHLGQSVDFVVSITFLRSPVLAILAMGRGFLLLRVSLHTSATADGFNGAVLAHSTRNISLEAAMTRSHQFNTRRTNQFGCAAVPDVTSWLVLAGGCWPPVGGAGVFAGAACGCELLAGG